MAANRKRVRECEQTGIMKFFKAVDCRVRTEEEIHVADHPTSVLDSDTFTDSTRAMQEVQVADLLPANFPEQELNFPEQDLNFPEQELNFPEHELNFPEQELNFPE